MEKLITEKKKNKIILKQQVKVEFETLIVEGAMKMPAYQYLAKKYKIGINTIMRYVNK